MFAYQRVPPINRFLSHGHQLRKSGDMTYVMRHLGPGRGVGVMGSGRDFGDLWGFEASKNGDFNDRSIKNGDFNDLSSQNRDLYNEDKTTRYGV